MKKLRMISAMIMGVVVLTSVISTHNPPKPPEWNTDKAHTSVSFEINHFFTGVEGRFDDFSINLAFDPEHPGSSSVEAEVQIESVNTSNDKRDNDLRSENFFNAKKYPSMKFVSSSFKKTGENEYEALGALTIKETTKEIAIPIAVLGVMDHPMRKGMQIIGLRAEFTINRTDFEVGTGAWMRTTVVGDEVTIIINMEANRKI